MSQTRNLRLNLSLRLLMKKISSSSQMGDRFIPTRSGTVRDLAAFCGRPSPPSLYGALLDDLVVPGRVLSFGSSLSLSRRPSASLPAFKPRRRFRLREERLAVGLLLLDSFCVNIMDWGCQGVLAVALGETVQLWRPPCETSEYLLVPKEEDERPVTSVSWALDGGRLAVGTGNGELQLWDVKRQKVTWRRPGVASGGVTSIISALSWKGENVLTSGAMSGLVQSHDTRVSGTDRAAARDFRGHRQGVSGLRWSDCGSQLASSDGRGTIFIWDSLSLMNKPLHRFKEHNGPVRALSWCPYRRHLLASGGMGEDEVIRFWNTQTGVCVKSVSCGLEVSGLVWSGSGKELMSAHGGGNLILWGYPSMAKVAEVRGHSSRVMFVARGPDGQCVATASGWDGDGCVRVWEVFGAQEKPRVPFAEFHHLR